MKKIAFTFILVTSIQFSFAQNFYDRSTIQLIEIFFASPTWDSQLDAAALNDAYIIADSVRINGLVFDSVGVKYKGNSSYNPNNNKNPFHIELDYIHGSYDYQGYTDIKLQNGYQDPSLIREVLSYAILEQYMDCPKANFANVYVNGTLRGLYSNAESINAKFNAEHYFSENGSFFKCNPVGGAGPGGGGVSPDLKWINSDSVSYYNGYELKSSYGWVDLVNLINILNNNFSQIESVMDVDRALWMLAFNNVLVNLDSYSGAFRQNYYLYNDLNDRMVPTVWDLNMSFAGFPGGTGSGPYTATTLDPMSNSTSANHPLILKMLGNAMYKRMYMAHLRTIVQEIFASGDYLNTANTIRTTIDAAVQADPYKFYTYTQYQNSLTTSVAGGGPGGGSSIPGIQQLMSARVNYFSTNSNYILAAPTISSYSASNPTPSFGETIYITVTCTNETSVYLGYRFEYPLKFNRLTMFDDGLHGDGAAGDHVWGVAVTLNAAIMEYYLYAENGLAGIFSPQRAEHEFHTLLVNVPNAVAGNVVINELMADNFSTAFDEFGESNDWIEFYNTTSNVLNLSGLYLSDDIFNVTKWQFPVGSIIEPDGYLIVWADMDTLQNGLHASFKLGASGESVFFTNGTSVFDQINFPALNPDQVYARCPDAGTFTYSTPTFAEANNCYLEANELNGEFVSIYPVPVSDFLNVNANISGDKVASIVDLNGRVIASYFYDDLNLVISTTDLAPGAYQLLIFTENKVINKSLVKF
jgi:spore coat protein CotH